MALERGDGSGVPNRGVKVEKVGQKRVKKFLAFGRGVQCEGQVFLVGKKTQEVLV
jgi:hypothetical protein